MNNTKNKKSSIAQYMRKMYYEPKTESINIEWVQLN